MKRKRYTEEKIISILKEHEAGASVPDMARRYGIAENTIYRWKSIVPPPIIRLLVPGNLYEGRNRRAVVNLLISEE